MIYSDIVNSEWFGGHKPTSTWRGLTLYPEKIVRAEAKMRDEMTGKRLFRDDEIPQNVTALATWIHNDVFYSL